MVEVSQKKSLTEGFGEVLRSSAIFYVRQYGGVSTTISFMDYWRSKRGLEVAIIATTRKMNGRKIGRTRLRFDGCGVINFQPFLGDEDEPGESAESEGGQHERVSEDALSGERVLSEPE